MNSGGLKIFLTLLTSPNISKNNPHRKYSTLWTLDPRFLSKLPFAVLVGLNTEDVNKF